VASPTAGRSASRTATATASANSHEESSAFVPTAFAPREREGPNLNVERAQALLLRRAGLALIALCYGAAFVALRWVDPLSTYGPAVQPVAWAFLFSGLAALACMALPKRRLPVALSTLCCSSALLLTGAAAALGWGVAAPGLEVLGLMVFAVGAANGWRVATGVAAWTALCLVALHLGWFPGPGGATTQAPTQLANWTWMAAHLLAVAMGLAGGLMAANGLSRRLRLTEQRERRFRGLLAMAADAYWEIDRDYRLVAAVFHDDESRELKPHSGLGQVVWESPRFGCEAETLDRLQADLDTRATFRDLPVSWLDGSGRAMRFLVSGEPRFDGRGHFTGYWGVARNISADVAAHEAMAATETRYQELFSRIPTPLVLHRGGRVFDANPAALLLFDQPDLSAMLGHDLLAHYEAGDSRERARRRLDDIELLEPGTALPVTDYRLTVQGRVVWVRATGVRVAAEGGPAVLSIYVDDTDRRAAEDAVRRSEAMLSHLVATSPELVTLTDLTTGRYVMVNHAFERVVGYRAAEAVGRTSLELGVWRQARDRDRLLERLRTQGSVADLPVTLVDKQGNELSLLVSAARFAMDRREYMVINARDVTESERARLEREAILANASVGIAVTRDRRFVLANRHFEQLYGWGPGEVLGQPGSVVWASDADYEGVGQLAGPPLLRGEAVEFERTGRRRDGSSFLARIRGRAVDPARPADGGTVWIVEDITERREFELALARARDDAEAASRAKSAFLANTSHELRTPLNGMIGMAQMAREPGLSADRRQQYLDQITESAHGLAGVISDILDLSKIEAGKLLIESTTFDLAELLWSLRRTYTTLVGARQLEVVFELDPAMMGEVVGDALRVRQIVTNYLSNALKFTERGRVTVKARRLTGVEQNGQDVRIDVVDTGEGISAEVQARLFKPFTQADESTTRRFGGTGLGLSICRELALLMGGRVGVHSNPNEGSTFWVELPLPPATLLKPRPPLVAEHALHDKRVLMVEDNPVNMMIAVAMLERWGVQVAQACDGQQAVARVQGAAEQQWPFDAVLMDVQMPVMSGHEATRAIRRTAAGLGLPIIALTAAALVTERDAAMAAGMNDFLTKPIDAERLRATLVRWTNPAG